MKINKRLINLSAWVALFTILIFPGEVFTEGTNRTEYGYPFVFFTQFKNEAESTRWFIKGISISLLPYLANMVIIYLILLGLNTSYIKLKSKKSNTYKKLY